MSNDHTDCGCGGADDACACDSESLTGTCNPAVPGYIEGSKNAAMWIVGLKKTQETRELTAEEEQLLSDAREVYAATRGCPTPEDDALRDQVMTRALKRAMGGPAATAGVLARAILDPIMERRGKAREMRDRMTLKAERAASLKIKRADQESARVRGILDRQAAHEQETEAWIARLDERELVQRLDAWS